MCVRRGGPLPAPIFMYEGRGQGPLRWFSVWVGVVSRNTLVGLGTDTAFFCFSGIPTFALILKDSSMHFISSALHNENIIICSTSETVFLFGRCHQALLFFKSSSTTCHTSCPFSCAAPFQGGDIIKKTKNDWLMAHCYKLLSCCDVKSS